VHVNAVASRDEERLCHALLGQDEDAFVALVEQYHSSLVRLAMVYVKNRAVAEEVVQETWLGVLRGLDRFERRCSLKTWIFRILVNTAKTHFAREARSVPFSSLADVPDDGAAPSVEADRFTSDGRWRSSPSAWSEMPESRLLSRETCGVIDEAIASLPCAQAEVLTLRDVGGWSSEEVCALLGISEGNQRVLLHRARSKVRAALEQHLG
jgi:RNA polymerase sigma-70 factor (ECF subfamily)